ncbi:putative Cysteinyl-tRNA synthetase [Leptomonas seymouri]|uniref:cysteine--tRNA ligase n=1 Tax=Leptomonas seymouri TaxID=5684 RepID=A0A0N0P2U0_LEPSE|nr:putative Cysteinyl-tRNA synthetase [Leptomonas seymouri]|eukprot:KPI83349.1 putative Cysteinyl-tRNA synthetase [Leptomonas seymouri]
MHSTANAAWAKVAGGLDGEHPIKRDRHPIWYPPTQVDGKGLKVANSLTETTEAFAPREGRLVRWYTCGPTVYDLSHMGHARAYLTFDILRRIMEDYFGYAVIYQMNITDIDDKIIKRARVNKLLDDFKEVDLHGSDVAKLKTFTAEAVAAAEAGLAKRKAKLAEPIPDNANSRAKTDREEKLMEAELKTAQLAETKEKIAAAKDDFEALFAAASGVNGDLLDELKGHSICDQQIFENHARQYERAFFDDMQRLGIRDPDIVTRVTEYVPEVVTFIQKIMDNGFAYKGESSIFFDTEAYVKAGHDYPKLKPGGDRNTTDDEMAEGEGALSKGVEGEKRSPNDFALWKFSKPGEPRWPSPWGEGRPGWHIECSVMASDVLGDNMDIHSGGWDLKFPHHDNECAQSEACNLQSQWVNYFLHCGHLHIKGLKMSKSLKNFITIRQALDDLGVTPRTMRLLFLANPWNKPMNFSDQSLDEAKEKERVLRAFFGSIDIVLRGDNWKSAQGANARDRELLNKWVETEGAVHAALQDNFDTVTALQQLMSLVAATNQYLLTGERPSATLLRKVGRYVTKMLHIFGVVEGVDDVGLQQQSSGDGEARFIEAVNTLVRFRDGVRDTAKAQKAVNVFLPLCDKVRDEWLIDAGVRLEDNPAGPTTWKNDEPALLRKELQERLEQQDGERKKKLANQIETKRKLVEKWQQFSCLPSEYLQRQDAQRGAEKKYAAFDESTGLPTKTVAGEDVGEKEIKKFSKEVAKYAKTYEEFMSKGGAPWLREQEAELASMVAELQGSK